MLTFVSCGKTEMEVSKDALASSAWSGVEVYATGEKRNAVVYFSQDASITITTWSRSD